MGKAGVFHRTTEHTHWGVVKEKKKQQTVHIRSGDAGGQTDRAGEIPAYTKSAL